MDKISEYKLKYPQWLNGIREYEDNYKQHKLLAYANKTHTPIFGDVARCHGDVACCHGDVTAKLRSESPLLRCVPAVTPAKRRSRSCSPGNTSKAAHREKSSTATRAKSSTATRAKSSTATRAKSSTCLATGRVGAASKQQKKAGARKKVSFVKSDVSQTPTSKYLQLLCHVGNMKPQGYKFHW